MIEIYQKDNFDLLKSIPSNHINLIYSDVLFGTGRNFGDYQDLRCDRRIIENHYIPRLIEMKRVLKENGSIYLQMDSRINHWVRCIMDDIFKYDNFKNEIIWWYKTGGSSKKEYCKKHDTILFYAFNQYIFNPQKQKNYTKSKNRKEGVINYGKGISEFYRDEKGVYNYTYQHDVFDIPYLNSQSKERTGYATQKPKQLIERIIKVSSNENDLVGDFYLGSGTTAVVCKELNRNFIGCDISKKAIDITNKRLYENENSLFK